MKSRKIYLLLILSALQFCYVYESFCLKICTVARYKDRAKSSVTNRLPKFYPRYILKCFIALEWCVK